MIIKLDAGQVAANYSRTLRELGRLTGFDQKTVLLGEAGIVLKTCAGRTKVATPDSIDKGTRLAVARKLGLTGGHDRLSNASINVGVRGPEGLIWWKTQNKKFQLAGFLNANAGRVGWQNLHFRDGDWSEIVSAVNKYRSSYAERQPLARRAAGLARQSWVQIALDLDIDLGAVKGGGTLSAAGIAKARAALATTGQAYLNGQGQQFGDAQRFFVRLTNGLPFGLNLGFDSLLLGVVNGRTKYLETSYAKGAFDSMSRMKRAFPWITVTPPVFTAVA
jgi:hypothetical protein